MFFYISTINSINNKRKIIITKDKIKKSLLFHVRCCQTRLVPPNSSDELGGFFYLNSIINTKINKG